MFAFYSEQTREEPCSGAFRGMAFDGCKYYLPVRCRKEVWVLDKRLGFIKALATCRVYRAVCFDEMRGGFWALSDDCPGAVYRLDLSLCERGKITPGVWGILSVSFCRDTGELLIAAGNRLYLTDPDGKSTREIPAPCSPRLITAALWAPPYIIFTALKDGRSYFVTADKNGEKVNAWEDERASFILAMAVCPCTCDILALVSRPGGYPGIEGISLGNEIKEGMRPPWGEAADKCREDENCLFTLADIIESLALIQGGTAHILNAQGEMLERHIELMAAPGEIMAASESLRRVIESITILETVITGELEVLLKALSREK